MQMYEVIDSDDDIEDLTQDILGIQDKFQTDLITLQQIFPECVDDHIMSLLVQYGNHPDRVAIVTNLLVEKSYPKKKDEKGKEKATGLTYDLNELKKDFYNIMPIVSVNYSEHW